MGGALKGVLAPLKGFGVDIKHPYGSYMAVSRH